MARTCPRDGTLLRTVKVAGFPLAFKVDECARCRGFFLDKGEVGKMTRRRGIEKLLHEYAGDRSPVACPGCGKGMKLRTLRAQGELHPSTVAQPGGWQ